MVWSRRKSKQNVLRAEILKMLKCDWRSGESGVCESSMLGVQSFYAVSEK